MVDALALGASERKLVEVRVLSPAPPKLALLPFIFLGFSAKLYPQNRFLADEPLFLG